MGIRGRAYEKDKNDAFKVQHIQKTIKLLTRAL